jgi:hypothetical protein
MPGRVGTVVIINRGEVGAPLLDWVRTLPETVALERPKGRQIPQLRNMGVAKGLAGEWVLFLDSDQVPRADLLPRMLSRNVAILSAVICERQPPWRICAMEGPMTEDLQRVDLARLPRTGLRQVTAAGTGCLLVRRPVFDAVLFPWFQCGQIRPDLLLEDVGFCLAAADKGFPTYLDCEARVGHDFGGGVVWPGRDGLPWIEWAPGVWTPAPTHLSTPDLQAAPREVLA